MSGIDDITPEQWNSMRSPMEPREPFTKPRDPKSMQYGGSHYKTKAIQPIEYIMGNGLDFAEGNVVKYITRHKDKGGEEDVLKALHYCKFILQHTYGNKEV